MPYSVEICNAMLKLINWINKQPNFVISKTEAKSLLIVNYFADFYEFHFKMIILVF